MLLLTSPDIGDDDQPRLSKLSIHLSISLSVHPSNLSIHPSIYPPRNDNPGRHAADHVDGRADADHRGVAATRQGQHGVGGRGDHRGVAVGRGRRHLPAHLLQEHQADVASFHRIRRVAPIRISIQGARESTLPRIAVSSRTRTVSRDLRHWASCSHRSAAAVALGKLFAPLYPRLIKPMSARSRSYADASGGKGDEDGSQTPPPCWLAAPRCVALTRTGRVRRPVIRSSGGSDLVRRRLRA